MTEKCPDNWGIGGHCFDTQPNTADIYITDPDGTMVHSATNWKVTAAHLAFAFKEIADLKLAAGIEAGRRFLPDATLGAIKLADKHGIPLSGITFNGHRIHESDVTRAIGARRRQKRAMGGAAPQRGHWSGTVGGPEPDQKSRFGTHPSWHPGWGIGWHEDKETGKISDLYISDATGAIVLRAGSWKLTADHLAHALMENRELRGTIEKLDKTADGQLMIPGMPVYLPGRRGRRHYIVNQPMVMAEPDGVQLNFAPGPPNDYYSTPELAEAAWQEALTAMPPEPPGTDMAKWAPTPKKRKWWRLWRKR